METSIFRKKRSVALTNKEYAKLKKHFFKFKVKHECASTLGVSSDTLTNVLLRGTGAEDTINIIRQKLSEVA